MKFHLLGSDDQTLRIKKLRYLCNIMKIGFN